MLKRIAIVAAIGFLGLVLGALPVMAQTKEAGLAVYEEARKLHDSARSEDDIKAAVQKYEEALKLFGQAGFDQGIGWVMRYLGNVYLDKKQYDKAFEYYQKALKYAPKSASIYSNLGTAYFARKKYKEAMATYQTALKLDPNVFENHGSYGVLLEERSVEERANFHFHMAKLYAQGGRNELALQYLRKALEEGFKDKKKIVEDPDFQAMRDLPEFKELLALEPRVL